MNFSQWHRKLAWCREAIGLATGASSTDKRVGEGYPRCSCSGTERAGCCWGAQSGKKVPSPRSRQPLV